MQSPVFSDFEDNTIGSNLSFTGLRTCWLGALRNHVRGSVVDIGNKMADPDANEFLANVIRGNIVCFANTPAVHMRRLREFPEPGSGAKRFGECAFNVRQPNPAPSVTAGADLRQDLTPCYPNAGPPAKVARRQVGRPHDVRGKPGLL